MRINLKSPTTQKWIIVSTIMFGVTYGYVNFLHVPRREKAKTLATAIKEETDLLTRGKRVAANFQSVQEDHARLMQSWDIAHELLPTQREMEDLLKSVTLAGEERNVSFLLFKPLEPVEKPYYWENPIQIRTLSSYHDLGEFLSAVAALDRIVNINNIKLTSYKPNRGRSPHTVEAEFTASIYIFKEIGAPVTVTAVEKGSKKPGKKKPGAEQGEEEGDKPPAKPKPIAKAKGEHA